MEKKETETLTTLLNDLKQLEIYIKAFWEFLPIPVCYTNPAFNILDFSKSFEKLLNLKSTEIAGESLEKMFPQQIFFEIKKDLFEKKSISNKEVVILNKEKKEIPVLLSVGLRTDEMGNVIGYFFAFLDITERKKTEQELKRKIEELEKFQKLTIGRELKMIELKKEIEKLKEELEKSKSPQ